jgi:uncharacterized protein (DUF2062 family)
MAIARSRRRVRGQWESLRRMLRYRLVVPVVRSTHSAEYTARGVANGVFWGLTPTVGLQSVEILATWSIGRLLGKDSSLLQAMIWVWVNNPVTMIPMYYGFYITGASMLGQGAQGYDAFVDIWTANAQLSWWARLLDILRAIGLPIFLGCLPYAAIGALLSYRWAAGVVRRRRWRLGVRAAIRSAR